MSARERRRPTDRCDPRLVKRLSVFASASAGFAVAVGLLGLAGWGLHIASLDTWGAPPVRLVPDTAASCILLGVALGLLRKEEQSRQPFAWARKLIARIAASIVCLMGLLVSVEHIGGFDFGFDQLLFVVPRAERIPGLRPGLVASSSACAFILLSTALLLLNWKTRRGIWLAQYLAFAAAIVAIFGFFALLIAPGVSGLTMAFPSAVAFLVLAAGLLGSRPTWVMGGLLSSQSAGARLLRKLIPAAFLVLGLIGWLISKALLTAAHFNWVQVSLLAILCGALLVGFVTWIAFIVDRSDALNAQLELRVAERTAALESEIAERKRAERALRSLSACNELLMRATDEPSLLQRICDLLVKVGGYRMAWVGYAESDEKKRVHVVAESGFEAGYLQNANLTWADQENGRGPMGVAIRTGEVSVCHDTSTDPCFAPWRENAMNRGYRSCVALPLKSGEEVLGAIAVYATKVGAFDAAEQHLLSELANNLSFGIMTLRIRVQRKWAEEALQESERRYRLLFDEMIVGFALLEAVYDEDEKPCDLRYVEANSAFETHSGLPQQEVLGRTIREVLPGLDPLWIETYGRVATTGESTHFERYCDPLEKWLEVTAFRTRQGQVGVTFADVTERRWAEEALKQSLVASEVMRQALADQKFALDQHAIVAVTDVTGRINYANDMFCAISKYSFEELIGRDHRIINSGHHPKEFFRQMYHTISQGKVWHGEIKNRAKDGSFYWVETTIVPFLDAHGKPRQYIAIRTDITEAKRAEQLLADKAEELARSNRELEQFAYVASHDLQEPLRMVASYTQLLSERYAGKLDENADKFLGYAREGALRMQVLIHDLLSFSRVVRADVTRKNVDCNVALEEAVRSLGAAIAENDAVVTHSELPTVWADQTQIAQVFQNLIGNAIKFRNGSPPECAVSAENSHGNWLFTVQDNGIGIAPEYAENIFVVFQRLHARTEYPGNGIGLAICKKIVEHYGGRIWVESQVGQGSTFKFTLPASAPKDKDEGRMPA
ncbi:MAG: ATP-binding protein [Terriglobales bacterium]